MATSRTATAKKTATSSKTASKPTPTKKTSASKTASAAKTSAAPRARTGATAQTVKAASVKAPARVGGSAPTPEQRYRMIQEAAYFIAERNGFAGGATDYWFEAEAQISAMISGKRA